MWKLKLSSQFKKDLKRYKNNPEKLVEVRIVLEQLQNRGTVDSNQVLSKVIVNAILKTIFY